MLVENIDSYKEHKIRISPCNSNRASQLGHECLRYLVYERTTWDQKIPHDIGLQYIFDIGNDVENIVIRELQEAGFNIEQQQRDFQDKDHHITGHIDSIINVDGDKYLLEIKSVSPYIFDTLNDEKSIKNHKLAYIRKYYAQLNLYLYLAGLGEKGILLFKNKTSGRYKEIMVNLDYDYCENLLQRASQIEKHLKENTLPDRIEFDENLCGTCPYNHICCPSPKSEGVKFVDNEEIRTLLEEYEALKEKAARFKIVDDLLKKELAEQDNIAVGDFHITGKWRPLTKYNVPQEIKDNYKEVSKYWVKKITRFAHNDAKEAHS